ncbi:MAG: hypothetical protein EPN86_05410 [Nanoarchaeota archaeon]|nr:MAG: hypothetical protein EPN86_05410 [Nanoarchaeota archaeon]
MKYNMYRRRGQYTAKGIVTGTGLVVLGAALTLYAITRVDDLAGKVKHTLMLDSGASYSQVLSDAKSLSADEQYRIVQQEWPSLSLAQKEGLVGPDIGAIVNDLYIGKR